MDCIDKGAALRFLDAHQGTVSCNGFLPQMLPLQELSDPSYSVWESLAFKLPTLLKTGSIRKAVADSPVVSTRALRSEEEWRRAYVILTYVSHAYVWGGEHPAEILPPQLSKPLLEVSTRLCLPPILTAAAANLWNYTSRSPTFSLSTIGPLLSFTGTETESWFLMVGVAVEKHGGVIAQVLFSAIRAAVAGNFGAIAASLKQLAAHIDELAQILVRLPEKCDAMVFYHEVRPFYAGTKNMASAGLPRGVFYETGDGQSAWRQLRGGSNGQSSLFPLIDAALGITHSSSSPPREQRQDQEDDYHADILQYMPVDHRTFITDFRGIWNVRRIIAAITDQKLAQDVTQAHDEAVAALVRFRNKHIQIVSRYIIVPSKKVPPRRGSETGNKPNLATMHQTRKHEALMGTSGTKLMPFLKGARQRTIMAASKPFQT